MSNKEKFELVAEMFFPKLLNTYRKTKKTLIARNLYGENIKQLLKSNEKYRDIHKGKRCFIIGNAPSINTQDLSLLKDEIVFTVNKMALNNQFESLESNYHFWFDYGYFKDESEEGKKHIADVVKKVKAKDNCPISFFALDIRNFVLENEIEKDIPVEYYSPVCFFDENYDTDMNFCDYLPIFHTVVDYCIAFAIYTGCTEIYLLGCDSTGILTWINNCENNHEKSDYAYEVTKEELNRQKNMFEGYTSEQRFKEYVPVFTDFRLLYSYCKKRNVKIVNCTKGGILDSLPREKYEDVIKNFNNK